jgi:hypothetical protein
METRNKREQWVGAAMLIGVALLVVVVGGSRLFASALVALFLAWLTSPLWIGWWAYKLGRSPWVWGSLALFITPIIPAIILYASTQRSEALALKERQLRFMTEDSFRHLMARYERTQSDRDLKELNLALSEYELRYKKLPEVYLASAKKAVAELSEEYKKTHDEKLVAQIQHLKQVIASGKTPSVR